MIERSKSGLTWRNTAPALMVASLSATQPREEMVFSGKYKTGEQILRLANERFAVPEMLFHPADIGIQEMGIPEAIVDSIQSLPEGRAPPQLSCSMESVCRVTNTFPLLSVSLHQRCSLTSIRTSS